MPRLKPRDARGVIALWVVVLGTAIMVTLSAVFDFGYLAFLMRQLQNLVDAAALAAAREYGPAPPVSNTCTTMYPADLAQRLRCQAQVFADQNPPWALYDINNPAYQPSAAELSLAADAPPPGDPNVNNDVVVPGEWRFGEPRADPTTRLANLGAFQALARCGVDNDTNGQPLFTPTLPVISESNAVRVQVILDLDRLGDTSEPEDLRVPLFFARWMNILFGEVCASAVAAWSGLASAPFNTVPLTVPLCLWDSDGDGIFPDDSDGDGYPDPIDDQTVFRIPSNVDNSSWSGLLLPNANTNDMRNMVWCAADHPSCTNPDIVQYMNVRYGDWITLNGGEITPLWQAMRGTYYRGSPYCTRTSPDGDCWVVIPVIDFECGTPFNQQARVIGFATFEIGEQATAYTFSPTEGHRIVGSFAWNPDASGSVGAPCLGTGCRAGLMQ